MVLVSRQVRAHTTVRTTLCMRVQSNPIIEHCSAVRCTHPLLCPMQSSIHPCCCQRTAIQFEGDYDI